MHLFTLPDHVQESSSLFRLDPRCFSNKLTSSELSMSYASTVSDKHCFMYLHHVDLIKQYLHLFSQRRVCLTHSTDFVSTAFIITQGRYDQMIICQFNSNLTRSADRNDPSLHSLFESFIKLKQYCLL